ncbi:hypothetical protein IMY05_C4582000200 [Salix suchowensis]|nr:hypothetical protein IMY05_C4582000200 [Salix suchowensis]
MNIHRSMEVLELLRLLSQGQKQWDDEDKLGKPGKIILKSGIIDKVWMRLQVFFNVSIENGNGAIMGRLRAIAMTRSSFFFLYNDRDVRRGKILVKSQALLHSEEETALAIQLKASVAEIDRKFNSLDDSEEHRQQQSEGHDDDEKEETTFNKDDNFNLLDTSFDSCSTLVLCTLWVSLIPDFIVCFLQV